MKGSANIGSYEYMSIRGATITVYGNGVYQHMSADERKIQEIICDHASIYAGFRDLKTRRSGPEIFIEFHLVVPGSVTVLQCHDLSDHLESDLKTEFPRANITIHAEPCNEGCTRWESSSPGTTSSRYAAAGHRCWMILSPGKCGILLPPKEPGSCSRSFTGMRLTILTTCAR